MKIISILRRVAKKNLLMVAFAIVSSLVCVLPVYADDVPSYRIGIAPSQRGFGIMNPGESYSDTFVVKNTGKEATKYSISITPYVVETENYEPNYTTQNQYTEITDWITVNKIAGELDAGEQEEISYTINVPSDIHGGAQAATIMVTMETENNNDGTAVQTVRQVGYVVYGNVDGDIIETGKVLENKVPSFLFNPPIYGTSVVENTGNVYTRATYKLQVFPLFSDEEVYTNEEKPEASIIFPETKRYNEIKWEGAPQLGIFKVRQTVKIFDDETVTEKIVFLCPLWFLFVAILLVFLIIFWIFSRIFKRRREV